MEIHAPTQPITTWKEVFVHLGIVTVGILIALGLEAMLEWRHHQSDAAEARANIVSELSDNKRELDSFLQEAPKAVERQKNVLEAMNILLAKRKLEMHELTMGFRNAELRDGSWTTAQATGALTYMPYDSVKTFESAYALQNMYLRMQENSIDAGVAALSVFQTGEDPGDLPPEDLRSEREKILASLSAFTIQVRIGQQLTKRYEQVLGK